jgi:hypothetical protein
VDNRRIARELVQIAKKLELAEDAYKERMDYIRKTMKVIESKLSAHEASFERGGKKNWGMVGDLGSLKERLQEINDFLR